MRVCDLLGGARCARCARVAAAPDAAAQAAEQRQQQGFHRLQLKIGGRAAAEDIVLTRSVHTTPHHRSTLAVDANRGMTVADAITLSESCRDLRLILEQPCNTYEELSALRPRTRHPVFIDEAARDVTDVLRAIGDGKGASASTAISVATPSPIATPQRPLPRSAISREVIDVPLHARFVAEMAMPPSD